MDKVVSISHALFAKRAHALFGPTPMFTFQPDEGDRDTCVCVRLMPAGDSAWVGLLPDKAIFCDRVRIGMRPRFVVHKDAELPTVCGLAHVAVVGRVSDDGEPHLEDRPDLVDAVRALCARTPFLPEDAVVIEVRPDDVQVDAGESPVHGAIPRT